MRKRWLLAAVVVVAAGLALVAGVAAHVIRSVDTPAFRRSILEQASAAAGTKVEARAVEVALLSGVTLRGVTVANPPPFAGRLLTADAFVLRYRLWPLLMGRVELARLSLEKPVVMLAMDSRGSFNYEKLSRASGGARSSNVSLPVEIVLSKLAVDGGHIVVRDARSAYVNVSDAGLDSSFAMAGGAVEGKGRIRAGEVNLADSLHVRSLDAPFVLSKGTADLEPIRARLAEGKLDGTVAVRLGGSLGFSAKVSLRNAELGRLLEEAKATQAASGRLSADASIQGATALASLKGGGKLHVDDCKVAHAPVLSLLATVLRVPELEHPEFQECRAEFTLGGGRAVVPVLSLKGRSIQLTGRGVTSLDSLAIDYDMTLALSRKLLDAIPARELRSAFQDRADGFGILDFKVTGTAAAPRTDLASRLGKAAAGRAVESGIQKLLHKKIF